jgi:4-amino-4-deoxy-L-arabinose transferase-like glycosyltransferase
MTRRSAPGLRRHLQGRSPILIIVLLALVLRLGAFATDIKPTYLAGLTAYQAEMARNALHHGRWFVVNPKALDHLQRLQDQRGRLLGPSEVGFVTVDHRATYEPEVLEMPGLAVALIGIWRTTGTENYTFVRLVQIVLDTVMVVLVYWIALVLTKRRRASLLASLMYALWPGAIILAKTPSLDTWAGYFVISAVALALWAQEGRRRVRRLALLGVTIGLGFYFRPFLIVLPFALAVAFGLGGNVSYRRALENAALPTVVALLLIAPWSIRNFVEFDRFIPARIGIGQALWQGLGETSNSFGAINNDAASVRLVHQERPDLKYPSPAFDDFLLHRATVAIAHHPIHYIWLVARRSLYLLPCLVALLWRRRFLIDRAPLVAVAFAVILPYVLVRMENRFWLPAAFAYLILVAAAAEGALSQASHSWTGGSGERAPAR